MAGGGARAKRKVAILGGGQAGLTVAFQLTDPCNPRSQEFEVTVYQMGWRLGGKGKTGRPTGRRWARNRIEEHGLHKWFGFYDNCFRQIRACYLELNRPAGAPMATFEEAFVGTNEAVFVERLDAGPRLWSISNLSNDAGPGEGGLFLSPWEYIEMALQGLARMLEASTLSGVPHLHLPARALLKLARVHAGFAYVVHLRGDSPALPALDRLRAGAGSRFEAGALQLLLAVLHRFMSLLWTAVRKDIETPKKDEERRLWILANLAYGCIAGGIRDGVLERGFDTINDLDFREWLARHSFDDGGLLLKSPVVEAIYAGCFAYPAGDTRVPAGAAYPPAGEVEAGVALHGLIRATFTYKGAFAYRFQAGTADTCYAPMYEVLRKRGVRFRFFHRVRRLQMERGRIGRVLLGEQARVTDEREAAGGYHPLVTINNLPCWPDAPLWGQLEDGARLRRKKADFEKPDPRLRAAEREVLLRRGRDFDDVVLAIPVAAHRAICEQLIGASRRWADSHRNVTTVRTQALQVWLTRTPRQLGFRVPREPIVTWLYDGDSPLNVWGDFSALLEQEGWRGPARPRALAYFCSTLEDGPGDPGDPFPDQAAADRRVRANAERLLNAGMGLLLPGAVDGRGFKWHLLHDPRPRAGAGAARLDAQFISANVAPTERYVLSQKGSSKHRLPVHDPREFPNLYLAGDWTESTLNCGCMEGATISGMLCAHSLSGYPRRHDIVGVDFLRPRPRRQARPNRRS